MSVYILSACYDYHEHTVIAVRASMDSAKQAAFDDPHKQTCVRIDWHDGEGGGGDVGGNPVVLGPPPMGEYVDSTVHYWIEEWTVGE